MVICLFVSGTKNVWKMNATGNSCCYFPEIKRGISWWMCCKPEDSKLNLSGKSIIVMHAANCYWISLQIESTATKMECACWFSISASLFCNAHDTFGHIQAINSMNEFSIWKLSQLWNCALADPNLWRTHENVLSRLVGCKDKRTTATLLQAIFDLQFLCVAWFQNFCVFSLLKFHLSISLFSPSGQTSQIMWKLVHDICKIFNFCVTKTETKMEWPLQTSHAQDHLASFSCATKRWVAESSTVTSYPLGIGRLCHSRGVFYPCRFWRSPLVDIRHSCFRETYPWMCDKNSFCFLIPRGRQKNLCNLHPKCIRPIPHAENGGRNKRNSSIQDWQNMRLSKSP